MVTTDALSSVLRIMRFKSTVIFNSDKCGSWTADTSGSGRCTFHLISSGDCFLHMPGETQATPLSQGDLIIFPNDSKHAITNREDINTAEDDLDGCDLEKTTGLICGFFDFDDPHRNPIIQALPEKVLVKGENNTLEPRLGSLISLMKSEVDESTTGADVVVDKLTEILFIYAVRSYIKDLSPSCGILAAMSDRQINNALNAIHDKPEEAWTVEKLANVAGSSRAAFSKTFTELLDLPPMAYVGQWRMRIAHTALKDGQKGMLEIAESVGYKSEVAFRKAFKQITGITPGAARKQEAIGI